MKLALVLASVVLGTSAVHADRALTVIQIRVRTDAGRFQLGAGATTGPQLTADLFAGYHLTDRWVVRVRERFVANTTELEAGYAIGVGKLALPTASIVRFKAFVLAGGGVTDDREPTAFAGGMLQTHLADFLTFELGARGSYAPVPPTAIARTLEPLPAERQWALEAFVGVSWLLGSPSYTCVYR